MFNCKALRNVVKKKKAAMENETYRFCIKDLQVLFSDFSCINIYSHIQPQSDINMTTLSEYIIQINSLKTPSLRSLWGGMQSFGMGSFLQAFLNGTFFGDLSALR